MKYKILKIDGEKIVSSYRKRVYVISQEELEKMRMFDTFTIRKTVDGDKVYKSYIDGRFYIIK